MRFLSKYAKYRAQARPQRTEAYASGAVNISQTALIAEFSIGEVTGDERALARQMFRFNGFYQEQDLVTIVEPDYRISAFDSRKAQEQNGWTDEERETVEAELTKLAVENPQELMLVEESKTEAPWPTYDLFPGNRNALVKKVIDDGFDLVEVLAYERENQNREEVVAAMEQALEDSEGAPVERVDEETLVG